MTDDKAEAVRLERCAALGIVGSADPQAYALQLLIQAADRAQLALNSASGERTGYLREIASGRVQEYVSVRERVKEMLKIPG